MRCAIHDTWHVAGVNCDVFFALHYRDHTLTCDVGCDYAGHIPAMTQRQRVASIFVPVVSFYFVLACIATALVHPTNLQMVDCRKGMRHTMSVVRCGLNCLTTAHSCMASLGKGIGFAVVTVVLHSLGGIGAHLLPTKQNTWLCGYHCVVTTCSAIWRGSHALFNRTTETQ